MIDLSRKPRKQNESKEDEVSKIIACIGLVAFSFLLWLMLTEAFIHGIY